ncbi:MAG: hypothetical protein B1H03_04160 [Planctomycetales bacterium 4484_113]|nr:MAG: hypothetical protein B1H03_04160 [Planctomycetales bacterium 4484_113]
MIGGVIYSVNRWLNEELSAKAPVAFTKGEELALPSYRVRWKQERSLNVNPRGLLSGATFEIFCLAARNDRKQARELADYALAAMRRWQEGTFFVPCYRDADPSSPVVGRIAFRDVENRELHLPEHPELAVHTVRALALSVNLPPN